MKNIKFIIINLLISLVFIGASEKASIQDLKVQANILAQNGDLNIAITVYLSVLEQEESIYSFDSLELAGTLNTIGDLYALKGELETSNTYYQRAVNIYEFKIIEIQKNNRISLNSLLKIQTDLGDSINLEVTRNKISAYKELDNPYLVTSLMLDEEDFSEEDSAIEFLDLGFTYLDIGLYSQAAENFSKALVLQSSNLDVDYF